LYQPATKAHRESPQRGDGRHHNDEQLIVATASHGSILDRGSDKQMQRRCRQGCHEGRSQTSRGHPLEVFIESRQPRLPARKRRARHAADFHTYERCAPTGTSLCPPPPARTGRCQRELRRLRDELAAVQRESVPAALILRAVALFDPVWDLLLVRESSASCTWSSNPSSMTMPQASLSSRSTPCVSQAWLLKPP
jgi:hypothetical protein